MKRFWGFTFGYLITIIGCLVAAAIFLYIASPDRYNVLVVGSDQRGTERARSDVMFVVSIPKSADENPFFLTVPRDTKVEDDEYGLQKMTHFYALGDRPDDGKSLGNIDLTQEHIEELLDVKMDATVEVTFQSFQELINELGGVALSGEIVSGEEALAVVRDRFTGGRSDFDRQADAREIFRGLLTKVKTPESAKALMAYFDEAEQARVQYSKIYTARFLIGAGIARRGDVSIGEMQDEAVPGESARIYTPDFGKELYYWVPDEEALETLVDENLK